MDSIDISELDKAAVLAALYNHAVKLGRTQKNRITIEKARMLLSARSVFYQARGVTLKVDLRGDDLYPAAYDREYGEGAARKALGELLETEEAVAIVAGMNAGGGDE